MLATGYFITLGEPLTSWKTKKQATASHCSDEAEYQSIAATTAKVTSNICWMSLVLIKSNFVKLLSNSQSTIHIEKNIVLPKTIKHVEINYHFVRKSFSLGT